MTREYLIIIAVSDSPTEVTNHEISSYLASNPIVEDLTATSYHAWFKSEQVKAQIFLTQIFVDTFFLKLNEEIFVTENLFAQFFFVF